MKTLNRRDFIKGAAVLSGVAVCGAAGNVMASEQEPAQGAIPSLPWGYKELDPEYARKLGHLGYYLEECGGGAFWAIMTALREKIGYPYTQVPLPTPEQFVEALKDPSKKPEFQVPMQYGVGGVINFGSLCGAPNGAASAIVYAMPFEQAKEIIPRLLRYYESASFPTDESNKMAEKGEFLVPKMKSAKVLPQSESDSVLCHVSVGKWCEKAGYASGSKERSERCGRLTGDIVAMAVKMMNASVKGELDTLYPMKLSHDTAGCRSCHSKGENFESGQFTRGFMECGSCHDVKMEPHRGTNKLQTAYGASVGTWAGAAVVGTIAGVGAHAVNRRITKGKNDEEE